MPKVSQWEAKSQICIAINNESNNELYICCHSIGFDWNTNEKSNAMEYYRYIQNLYYRCIAVMLLSLTYQLFGTHPMRNVVYVFHKLEWPPVSHSGRFDNGGGGDALLARVLVLCLLRLFLGSCSGVTIGVIDLDSLLLIVKRVSFRHFVERV